MKDIFSQIFLDFPLQFSKGLKAAREVRAKGDFDKLIVCGMGGSALPADILKAYLTVKKFKLPLFVCRDYHLPLEADKKSLIFVSSYSGNTEETLSCYQEAKAKGLKIVGFARGGKLAEVCQKDSALFVTFPSERAFFQPRFALGCAFSAMLSVLVNSKVIPDILTEIENLAMALKPEKFESLGKKLALKSKNAIPIFYAGVPYGESLARICKINVNENAKTQAFWNVFPELNHNEMVGFSKLNGKFHLIMFKDAADAPRVLKRMKITADILRKKAVLVSEISLMGKTFLEKIFNGLMFGAWFSYHLALIYHQDPIQVKMVEEFKRKI